MKHSRELLIGCLLFLLLGCALPGGTPQSTIQAPPPRPAEVSVTTARVEIETIIFAGQSTLLEGACVQTQLFARTAPLDWWPVNECVPIENGAWEQRVALGRDGTPPTLDPALDYTLRAWAYDDPAIQSELFWLELDTPPAIAAPVPDLDAWPILQAYPLEVGAMRIYSVTVAEDRLGQWTGRVTETIVSTQEHGTAWVFFSDVAGHPLADGPKAFTYIVFPDRVYRLMDHISPASLIAADGVEYEWQLLYRTEMLEGDHWGPPGMDTSYHWWVERYDGCYQLALRTNPDHTFLRVCQERGLVEREYGHHGSLHDERWVLESLWLPQAFFFPVQVSPPPDTLAPAPRYNDSLSWLRDYLQWVTDLLNSVDGNLELVLAELIYPTAEGAGDRPLYLWAEQIDLDDDGVPEVLLSIPDPEQLCDPGFCPAYLVIFTQEQGLYRPRAFITDPNPVFTWLKMNSCRVERVADINADGHTEVMLTTEMCGAHTCYTGFIIGRWNGQRWQQLHTEEITQAYSEWELVDTNGDGRLEIVMTGGMIGSAGAGLQRPHRRTYTWHDGRYRLLEDYPLSQEHPYYWMLDANAALARGDRDQALRWASLVMTYYPLEGYPFLNEEEGTRARLISYASIEAMLVHALNDEAQLMEDVYFWLMTRSFAAPNDPYPQAAWVLLETYQQTGDALQACQAMEDYVTDHVEDAVFFEWYGYNTERLTLDQICPLDAPNGRTTDL